MRCVCFCCKTMEQSIKETKSVIYNEVFDEYGIPCKEDNGLSFITLDFCPWCGKKLPDSQRDRWFEELEKIGFDNPFDEDIPKEFRTSDWRYAQIDDCSTRNGLKSLKK